MVCGNSPAARSPLSRELHEEIGVTITASRPFMDLHFKYPDRSVDLEFFLVEAWEGEPAGLEGQALRWVSPSELDDATLLPADKPVIEALRSL